MKKIIDFFFSLSLVIKGIDAFLEIAASIFLFFASERILQLVAYQLTQRELFEDPSDYFARYLLHTASIISPSGLEFATFYLFIHGIIKLILIISLFLKQRWAYPTAMVIFAAFIVYQLMRYSHTHSVLLLILSLLDAIVIWLIWREYMMLPALYARK